MTGLDFLLMPYLGVLAATSPLPAQLQAASAVATAPAVTATISAGISQEEEQEPSADDLNAQALEEVQDAPEAEYVAPLEIDEAETGAQPDALEGEIVPVPAVFADLTDEQVFDRATEYLQSITTLQARFIQTAPSGNISTGTLQMSRPSRLRVAYDAPNPNLIVATQGMVYLHDADLETTDSYPLRRTPLKFLLSKELKPEDAMLTEVARGPGAVALTLESTDPETEGSLTLVFAAPEFELARWAVFDGRGLTVVDLEELETGVRISNAAFRIPEAGGSFLRDR